MEFLIDFVHADFLGKPAWLWLAFLGAVAALLAFDLGVLHRDDRQIGVRESLVLSAGYVAMGLAFGAWVWWYLGADSGLQYLTGFMIEKTLAMDNVFVIAMIFTFFAVPPQYQHRVLFWGILGVILLRAIMIGLGAALVTQFSWTLYVFGAILVATGVKMLFFMQQDFDIADNGLLRFLRRRLRVTEAAHGNRFWVKLPAPDVAGAFLIERTSRRNPSVCQNESDQLEQSSDRVEQYEVRRRLRMSRNRPIAQRAAAVCRGAA